MITIEQFDAEMIKQVNRQLELCKKNGVKLSVEDIVKISLTNMSKGNYAGITSSVKPFFSSINVEKKLEELMDCEFPSAVYLYSRRIGSFYKNDIASRLKGQFKNMDELKQLVDSLYDNMETADLINLLKETYYNNDSVSAFIEEAYEFVSRKGGAFLDDSLDNKIKAFITYIRYYHDNFVKDQYKASVKQNAKNIDDNLLMLDIPLNEKKQLLTDLYYGNYNKHLSDLKNNIEKSDVMISLLRNAVQTSLVSTNVIETSPNERILYQNARDMEDILMSTRGIIGKLLGQDVNAKMSNLNSQELSNNLNSLTYEDIDFLSRLYIGIRRDEQCVGIVEKSLNKDYRISDLNQNQFVNDSSLLKLLESKKFKEELSKQYHI